MNRPFTCFNWFHIIHMEGKRVRNCLIHVFWLFLDNRSRNLTLIIYTCSFGISSNASSETPKLAARTSFGVLANQSVMVKVLFSEKSPSSKTSKNSAPSFNPLMECGIPPGKYHMPPSCTSSINERPSSSTAVTRALPLIINAHSASLCQCSSRTPPGSKCILTPASVSEIGSSLVVVSRDQPPSFILICDSAYGHFKLGNVPLSVTGGVTVSGFCFSIASFLAPNISPPLPSLIGFGADFFCSSIIQILLSFIRFFLL